MTIQTTPQPWWMQSSAWTGKSFSVMRAFFGVYLTTHFISLMAWGVEMFSREGVIPVASHSPLMRAFPNIFGLWDGPVFVQVILGVAVLASVLFTLGWRRRVMAVVLWYIWAILLGRNPLILNPGMPYVGWMLLCFAALPSGPEGSLDHKRHTSWQLPKVYITAAWIVMTLGYSYSGAMKLGSASWIDGSAIAHVLASPLARPGVLREWLITQPGLLLVMTWGTLALELLAAPLALVRRARPYLWWALVMLHAGILCTVDFSDLTLGMLMIHMLTWDPAWRRRTKAAPAVVAGAAMNTSQVTG